MQWPTHDNDRKLTIRLHVQVNQTYDLESIQLQIVRKDVTTDSMLSSDDQPSEDFAEDPQIMPN